MDDKKGLKLKDHDLKFLLQEIKHSCIINEPRANSEEVISSVGDILLCII